MNCPNCTVKMEEILIDKDRYLYGVIQAIERLVGYKCPACKKEYDLEDLEGLPI